VQTYITSTSTAGTSLICRLLLYDADTETWVELTSSPLKNIEEEDLGTWVSFTFTDQANIILGEEETSKDVKVALEFYYNGTDNDLWIGEDNSMTCSGWGTTWIIGDYTEWTAITNYVNSSPMIRAFIIPTLDNVASNFAQNDINMYPNPSTGIVTISNVEGATIEVINLMGQVVASIENANEINNIDLSKNAEGTYIVRIINGNEISTSKLNLVK
jgi:hypothetical protein